jgi:hypothetical protein
MLIKIVNSSLGDYWLSTTEAKPDQGDGLPVWTEAEVKLLCEQGKTDRITIQKLYEVSKIFHGHLA